MDVGSLRAGSPLSHVREPRRAKRFGVKETGEEVPRRCFAARLGVRGVALQSLIACCVKFAYGIREREIVFWSWRSRLMKNFCIKLLTKSLYDRTFDYMNRYQRLPSGVRLEEANGLEILNCFHSCSLCKLGNDPPCSYFRAIKFLFLSYVHALISTY